MCHFGIRDFRLWTFSWSTETFEMQSMLLTMQSLDQVCFLQEKEKTGKFCDFWSIFNRFNIWWICLLIQQHFLPLWLFEWYQFKKDSGDTEWITKLIINDRPNCHILYITTMTAVRYYSKKCSYGATAAPAQKKWFSVLKFVTMWGLELTAFWLKKQALMCWAKQPKKVSDISQKVCSILVKELWA